MISPVTNRVPYSSKIISNFNGEISNLIYSCNFILILNEYVYSVNEISGIDIDYRYESDFHHGGSEWPVYVRNYNSDFVRINLKRTMPIKKSRLFSAAVKGALAAAANMLVSGSFGGGVAKNLVRKTAMLAAAALDPIETLERGPAIGIIQIFSRDFSKDVANFKFFSYGAEKWTMSPELDASSGNIVYESIDLVCTDLVRMTTDWSSGPSGIWNYVKNDTSSMYDYSEMEDLERLREASLDNIKNVRERQKEKLKGKNLSIDDQIKKLEKDYGVLAKTYEEIKDEFDKQRKEKFEEIKEENKKRNASLLNEAKKQVEIEKEKQKEEGNKKRNEALKEIERLKRIKQYNDNKNK